MTTDTKDKVDGPSPIEQLSDLLAMHRRNMELDLRVAVPATVAAYNPATRRADVLLAFLPVIYVGDEEVPQAPIVCPQVPVVTQGGALAYVDTPILAGDTGLVVFADRCLAQFLLLGGSLDPINGRTHSLGDGLFIPARLGPLAVAAPLDPTGTVVEGPLVKLGSGAIQFGLLGTALASTCATLHSTLLAVPAATDPITVNALANANKAAVLGLLSGIQAAVSTKVLIE